ncbi:MAG: cysteine desulfurase family protein [Microthrixaceae bacterium]
MSESPEDVIYLDHAATTPTRPEVVEAMAPFMNDRFGNPSGSHVVARSAVNAMDEAREVIAGIIGAEPGDVIFTSGGTEADNHAITGGLPSRSGVPICSAVEHHAVLDVVEALGGRTVAVDSQCRVSIDSLKAALDETGEETSIVSVMLANNEVGTINDLGPIADLVAEYSPQERRIPLHTDAVQAAAWLDLRAAASRADLISVSAHKLGGPKGIGALVVRKGTPIRPMILGGGQERGRRSGTPSVAAIVGFATALRMVDSERDLVTERVIGLRRRFIDGLSESIDEIVATIDDARTVPGTCHVCFEGADSESLLLLFESAGLVASAGSSCSSGASEPSHVLSAMSVADKLRDGAIRFSIGHGTTEDDIERAVDLIPGAVSRARAFFS